MKLEQQELPFLFETISLPDVFFSEYLSEIPGDFLKIYLYCIFLAKHNKSISINDLSKKLTLPLKTIQESFVFLEELGLLIKNGNDFIVHSVQEKELQK